MKELASRPEEGFTVLLKHDKPDVQRPSWLLGLVHQSPPLQTLTHHLSYLIAKPKTRQFLPS